MEIKRGYINKLASMAGITHGYVSNIMLGRKRPQYKVAARLAAATETDPIVWLAGSPEEIRAAIVEAEDRLRLEREAKHRADYSRWLEEQEDQEF